MAKIKNILRVRPSTAAVTRTVTTKKSSRKHMMMTKKMKRVQYEEALKKSSLAWIIMNIKVLVPLLMFIKNNTNLLTKKESKRVGFDFSMNLNPAVKILIIKNVTSNSKRRLRNLFHRIRKIRNDLAHNLNLMKRTKHTYIKYAQVWGELLTLIGEGKLKRAMMSAVKRLNKTSARRQHQPFKITNIEQ